MKRHAVALHAITHADDAWDKGAKILDMDPNQFRDWRDAGMVREATAAEVAAARGKPLPQPVPNKAPTPAKAVKPTTPTTKPTSRKAS